jgi:hypothetical protein
MTQTTRTAMVYTAPNPDKQPSEVAENMPVPSRSDNNNPVSYSLNTVKMISFPYSSLLLPPLS